ncbi:MAG: hypothetical protein ABSC05_19770 [Candidatus Solibacter sp.]|jgi:hypothetical protein
MTPLDFLNLLWQFKPAELYVLLWTYPEKRSRWYRDIVAAAEFVLKSPGLDVYVGVGLSMADHGPARRCVSEEIAGISGFWADLDLRSDAHNKKALPATIADALSIIPASLPPTIVILTGNGAHAWWLFKEPYIFDGDDDREAVASQSARWHTLLSLNASARGWAYDRLSDLARILRIPGTQNLKDPANPKDVVVHSFGDRRYNLSDFTQYLDDAAIPDPQAQDSAAREWAERFADKSLLINTNARIPQEMLDGWMAADMRFKNTWLRQRHDLKDQSQSGYDLALACFGTEAGLNEQQIVDLIIHHRSQSGQKHRTRLDYFQRTIATASRRSPGVNAPGVLPDAPAPGATTGNAAPPGAQGAPQEADARIAASPDPATTRALLCQRISEILGVRVCRIVKFTGKEPTFHMELEEGKIEFPNVGKLISQESVRLAIAGSIGKLIRKLKPKVWEQLAQVLLDACIVEQGGEEIEWEGAARMYVAHYLAETGFIDTLEGQQVQNQRKPILLDGKVAICTSDLQMYVNKTTFQNLSIKAVASMLGVLGGKSIRVRGAKFKEQSRWILPVDQFDPAEYSPHKEETDAQ